MAGSYQSPGARYGIWGVNPYGMPYKVASPMETALKTGEGIAGLFTKRYQNQQEQAKAQLMQDTLQGEIAAKNATNKANEVYYPLQQAAKLQQERATIKEIQARTGVSYQQAKHLAAQTNLVNTQQQMTGDPAYQYKNLLTQWQNAPEGSDLKKGLAYMLDMTAAGLGFPSKTGKASGAGAGSAAGGMVATPEGAQFKDPRFGTNRSGAGGTYVSPKTGQTVSTQTNANTTQDQKTIAAIERVKPLLSDIMDKQAPFLTLQGKGALTAGRLQNLIGKDNRLPSKYAQAQADAELVAEGMIKAYGLNVTDQSAQMMKAAIKPLFGESKEGYKERLINTLKTIETNQREAEQRLKSGIPVGQEQMPNAPGYFTNQTTGTPAQTSAQAPQAPRQVPQQQQANQQRVQQLQGMAQEAIKNGADPKLVNAELERQLRGG